MAVEFKSVFAGLQGDADEGITLDEHASAPGTPASGKVVIYAKADGKVYRKDDGGTETELGGGAYTQSDTAPISPVNGDKWLDTTTGTEYVRYDAQWISDAPASNLTTSLTLAYRAITALRTLDSSDYTVDCTANSFTVTLPTAVGIGGRVYNIKNTGNGLITVDTTSSQTIDGAASGTITLAQYACLTVQSTGANWIIL